MVLGLPRRHTVPVGADTTGGAIEIACGIGARRSGSTVSIRPARRYANSDRLGRSCTASPDLRVPNMAASPPQFRSPARRPPAWQRWVLNALHNFDLYTIDDWAVLMKSHLERSGGATPNADCSLYRRRTALRAEPQACNRNPCRAGEPGGSLPAGRCRSRPKVRSRQAS